MRQVRSVSLGDCLFMDQMIKTTFNSQADKLLLRTLRQANLEPYEISTMELLANLAGF